MCGSFGPEFALCVGALYNVSEFWTGVRIMCGSFVCVGVLDRRSYSV